MKEHRSALAVLASMLAGFALVVAAAHNGSYALVLFVATPFLTGFVAALIYSWGRHRTLGDCIWISLLPFLGICVLVLVFAVDGLICCLMAAPIAVPLGMLGAWLAWLLQSHKASVVIASSLLLLIPPGIFFGPHGPQPQTFSTTTAIAINAPPEVVWRYVTGFPAIAEPPEALFRAGVAYPIRSDIDGTGIGTSRQCVLSTGTIEETVTAWEPPALLRFRVNSTPPAMHELSPWGDIDPPHLHGFYQSMQGEFRLIELPGHRTLVEGTSWYSHGLQPAQYWRLWSDYVVHGVHRRVLEHIRTLAEQDNLRRASR